MSATTTTFDPAQLLGGAVLKMIPVELVDFDGRNLRRENGDVNGLQKSLETVGMLQPVSLRPAPGGRYELVAGHRRFAAAVRAGASAVPALVREMDEHMKWQARLSENLHRLDLTPSEEGRMFEHLLVLGYTQREVAEMASRSVSHVCERLKLLEWPADVVRRVDLGELTLTAAKRLVNPAPATDGERLGGRTTRDEAAQKDSCVLNSFTLQELARFPGRHRRRRVDPDPDPHAGAAVAAGGVAGAGAAGSLGKAGVMSRPQGLQSTPARRTADPLAGGRIRTAAASTAGETVVEPAVGIAGGGRSGAKPTGA
jgi:ParB/RepB/Spo0J family partition protein